MNARTMRSRSITRARRAFVATITRARGAFVATIALATAAACSGDKPPANTPSADMAASSSLGGAVNAAATAAPSPVNVPGGPCYLREIWDECGLIKRLENSGYVPKVAGRDAGSLARSFNAPFVDLALGRGKLRAFIYANAALADADYAKADTAGQGECPPPRTAKYGGTLLHSANMIAILEADNENTCVRIGDLVNAGLPKLERK